MKKLLCLFGALALVLASCSSDDNKEESAILPKTIKYSSVAYPSENSTRVATYNGTKIVSIKDETGRTDYTYDGNLVVKETNYDTESGKDIISDVTTYKYTNGKLTEYTYAEAFSTAFPNGEYNSRIVFTHNADGTVTRERYNINGNTETKSNYSEVLTFANGNLVKSVQTDSQSGSVFTAQYEYDNKNSPYKNITGFNFLIDHSEGEGSVYSSVNNIVKYTASYSNETPNVYKSEIVYDANNFPSKITNFKRDGITAAESYEYTY
ncbi:hypothetical protein NU08_1244 [Flavobacterium anhuiense]|uniref:YD repeat-containing protein n=1 Tax=Flavobacterium anhuiense TaxID=459526 RepID=A0A444W108_9FLAO|nr:hypothetical protein [Flavobacterium anhuiense]RYJ39575.1 hypothetical protein NU08_1244 [Flavobacterium anhuiense]